MSQLRFSKGLVKDYHNTGFFKKSDYEVLLALCKELAWGEDFSESNGFVAGMLAYGFEFPLTPLNVDTFLIAIIGLTSRRSSFLQGNHTGSRIVNRPFGCFSNREVVAFNRLSEEYSLGWDLIDSLSNSCLWLVKEFGNDGFLTPVKDPDCRAYYVSSIWINRINFFPSLGVAIGR